MPWKDLLNPVIGLKEGLNDPVCDLGMGDTAEILAKEGHITREEQDHFALRSHQRATEARAKLAAEIVPVPVPPDYDRVLTFDNGVRENQTMEALAKLKPVFDRRTAPSRPATRRRSRTAARPSSSPRRSSSRSTA